VGGALLEVVVLVRLLQLFHQLLIELLPELHETGFGGNGGKTKTGKVSSSSWWFDSR